MCYGFTAFNVRAQRLRTMAMPTYIEMIEPLLRYLVLHPDGVTTAVAQSFIADHFKLTEDERATLLPSTNQAAYKNRAGWAHDRLKRAKLSTSVKRGFWRVTPKGVDFAKANPVLAGAALEEIWKVDSSTALSSLAATDPNMKSAPTPTTTPQESIYLAAAEIRKGVELDLLTKAQSLDPTAFERLVLKLLHAMGYGARAADLKHTGGSGDGGIDGIISLDRLGLERVYVQAKRWQTGSAVNGSNLREFMGALQENHANKGVYMTTSSFNGAAKEAAGKAPSRIILLDGGQIAALMVEHNVGVTQQTVLLPQIDDEWFDGV
jgi:restriction system protein